MGNFFSQSYFLPTPIITEHTCPSQQGRIFIVTGGYAGVGFELTRILVARGATVYIAGRSESKAAAAITKIREAAAAAAAATPTSHAGRVEFLSLDLAELATIKPAVNRFLAQESRLDVLVNNAGVMFPPSTLLPPSSHAGQDLTLLTNCLGPYLLYTLLAPILARTAASSPTASVRVAWAGSIALDAVAPQPGGLRLDNQGSPEKMTREGMYAQSKTGNYFFGREFARASRETGVVHVCFNPGNLRTGLQRHWSGWEATLTDWLLVFPPYFGAYTELWAAVSLDITPDQSGAYIWPWGRFGKVRPDIDLAAKSVAEGGTGVAARFVEWCERETVAFA